MHGSKIQMHFLTNTGLDGLENGAQISVPRAEHLMTLIVQKNYKNKMFNVNN